MNLENSLSEISQIQKEKYCMNIEGSGKFIETESRTEVTRSWGRDRGNYLMGTQLLFGRTDRFWRWAARQHYKCT